MLAHSLAQAISAVKVETQLCCCVQNSDTAVVVYARPEDEFYHKHCSWSYTFPITSKEVEKDELRPLRLVLCMTSQQATTAR